MDSLTRLGAALGGTRYVQGPGGNISVKDGDRLRVKASGKRLRELGQPGAHADVPLELARRALQGDQAADTELFAHRPRPSLEAYFHALGGHIVAHTHALGALLVACSDDEHFARRLPADVIPVGYERPGRGLALLVQEALGAREHAVLILRSHGLIVYAPDVESAIATTLAVDDACRAHFAALPDFDVQVSAAYSPEALAGDAGIMTALPARRAEPGRYLCPDAVVFGTVVRVSTLDQRQAEAAAALASFRRPVVLQADNGQRLLVARNADELAQAREVVLAHDWAMDALEGAGGALYLPPEEPAKIVNMPSEQYRLALTEGR